MSGGCSWLDDSNTLLNLPSSPSQIHHSGRNVFHLLARREISPRTKCLPRRLWGESPKHTSESTLGLSDARNDLFSWVEAESLHHFSAKYCPFVPPPRSTIAAAFSPDGRTLASTHGDHTVKIIDWLSGKCLKVLSGHRRTPWVVRFHPQHPEIIASGSLDHEVRLWDANTSECIGSRDFYRPIASIAFHAEGKLLAVASGHKLYIWHYNGKEETSSPNIVLKTRRSLRAVHFHPHGAPFLLTAEVNDLDSSDSTMARATSLGCLTYPPPAVYLANVYSRSLGSSSMQVESSAPMQQRDVAPLMEMSPVPLEAFVADTSADDYGDGMQSSEMGMGGVMTSEAGPSEEYHPFNPSSYGVPGSVPNQLDMLPTGIRQNQHLPSRNQSCWSLPFLQGWLMGQSQAGMQQMLPLDGGGTHEYSSGYHDSHSSGREIPMASLNMPPITSQPIVSGRSGLRGHSIHTNFISPSEIRHSAASISTPHEGGDSGPIISRIQSELAASLAGTAAAEMPCTVKLKIWPHDIKNPYAPLNSGSCRLAIPHAVLCSEMGAHFSPCGRYLAACVACVLPQMEADPGPLTQLNQDFTGAAMSPTRHPISARQIMYELRIYSLEESTFGMVLISRAIRAAHCLTSIQFSPTSEHILLAYGRRHSSLLKSIVINGETSLPIYTVLEIYRVSDMELVSILPSAEDEVNVACFHPSAGGGLVYGTKEGKLRVLQYAGTHDLNDIGPNFFTENNMVEVQTYALEG